MAHRKDVIIVPAALNVERCPGAVASTGIPAFAPSLLLLLVDRLLGMLNPFPRVPHAIIGVFLVVVVGASVRHRDGKVWDAFENFVRPAQTSLTHTYLALFYSPALVLLPVAMPPESISIDLIARVVFIITCGCLLTTLFTSYVVFFIRKCSKNEHPVPESIEQDDIRFSMGAILLWLLVAAVSSALSWSAGFVTLSQLSLSVCVYMLSIRIPRPFNRVLNPMVVIALVMNLHALLLARIHDNLTYTTVINIYSTTVRPVFFGFLGPIILCFAIIIVQRWELVVAHRLELLVACFSSASITIVSTAFVALHTLDPRDGESLLITRSLMSRGMTMALAVVNTSLLGGSVAMTAAAVALTGLIGSIMVRPLLNALDFKDVIVRGVTASATAHGLGAAVLGQVEPDCLPYAGLAYVVCGVSGVVCTLLFHDQLLAMVAK